MDRFAEVVFSIIKVEVCGTRIPDKEVSTMHAKHSRL